MTTKNRQNSSVNIRDLALEALLSIAREEAYSHVVVSGILDKYNYLEVQEKAFLKRLIEGTLERRIQLDYCIDLVSKTPVKRMKPLIRELLRMSTYQLLFMDSVPDSAVCNEAVKLAQKHSFHSLKGFVNGVLRNISRGKEQITYPDRETDRIKALSIQYSIPPWMIEKWDEEQGKERTEQILEGLLEEKPVTVRLRTGLSEAELIGIQTELEKSGTLVKKSVALPFAWYLEKAEGLRNFTAFQNGKFTVQDISSMLAVQAAGISPGDYVIDTCAAPGGKMLFASELTGADGRVLARDVSERKLLLMEENKNRMQAKNVILEHFDACTYDEEQEQKADVVLADVPCSGLGVIGKKRDIKYRVTPEGIRSLPDLQKEILQTVQHYVKPGGVLLYSTCTINRAENEEMVQWFLQNFPFHTESLRPFLPGQFEGETMENGYFQFLPGIHETDGFFIARFRREN